MTKKRPAKPQNRPARKPQGREGVPLQVYVSEALLGQINEAVALSKLGRSQWVRAVLEWASVQHQFRRPVFAVEADRLAPASPTLARPRVALTRSFNPDDPA